MRIDRLAMAIALVLGAASFVVPGAHGDVIFSNWIAPFGDWDEPSMWNPPMVPDNADGNEYHVAVDMGQIMLSRPVEITSFYFGPAGPELGLIDPTASLTVKDHCQLRGGDLWGLGQIACEGPAEIGGGSPLSFDCEITFSGLTTGADGSIVYVFPGGTIKFEGGYESAHTTMWTNTGRVEATKSTVRFAGDHAAVENRGVFAAVNDGTLAFTQGAQMTDAGGSGEIDGLASALEVSQGAAVEMQSLSLTGGGSAHVMSGTLSGGTCDVGNGVQFQDYLFQGGSADMKAGFGTGPGELDEVQISYNQTLTCSGATVTDEGAFVAIGKSNAMCENYTSGGISIFDDSMHTVTEWLHVAGGAYILENGAVLHAAPDTGDPPVIVEVDPGAAMILESGATATCQAAVYIDGFVSVGPACTFQADWVTSGDDQGEGLNIGGQFDVTGPASLLTTTVPVTVYPNGELFFGDQGQGWIENNVTIEPGGSLQAAGGSDVVIGGDCDIDGDCQLNGVPDECGLDVVGDLATRGQFNATGKWTIDVDGDWTNDGDANLNGIPDECDVDVEGTLANNGRFRCDRADLSIGQDLINNDELHLNENGIPDDCEVSVGRDVVNDGHFDWGGAHLGVGRDFVNRGEVDLNENGIPDSCDIDIDRDLVNEGDFECDGDPGDLIGLTIGNSLQNPGTFGIYDCTVRITTGEVVNTGGTLKVDGGSLKVEAPLGSGLSLIGGSYNALNGATVNFFSPNGEFLFGEANFLGEDPGDLDVYSFETVPGTEVWIDLDRTTHAVDTIVELVGDGAKLTGDKLQLDNSTLNVTGDTNNEATIILVNSDVTCGGDFDNEDDGDIDLDDFSEFQVGFGAVPPSAGFAAALIAGGNMTNAGSVRIGTGSLFRAGASYTNTGTTTLDGGTLEAPLILIEDGLLAGDGKVVGDVTNAGGTAPGLSPGTLTIDGSFTQTDTGLLQIELGELAFDQLVVTGTATLGGTLEIVLLPNVDFSTGDLFDILVAQAIEGSFATELLPTDEQGQPFFSLTYGPRALQLTALRDYVSEDIIPEPATLSLLALGGIGLLVRRRKQR